MCVCGTPHCFWRIHKDLLLPCGTRLLGVRLLCSGERTTPSATVAGSPHPAYASWIAKYGGDEFESAVLQASAPAASFLVLSVHAVGGSLRSCCTAAAVIH